MNRSIANKWNNTNAIQGAADWVVIELEGLWVIAIAGGRRILSAAWSTGHTERECSITMSWMMANLLVAATTATATLTVAGRGLSRSIVGRWSRLRRHSHAGSPGLVSLLGQLMLLSQASPVQFCFIIDNCHITPDFDVSPFQLRLSVREERYTLRRLEWIAARWV